VQGRELVYKQVENSFTQPNAAINEQMLGWALDVTKGSEGDLLELYCGNGNFSIALAQNFRKVLATEIAKPSVDSAQFNIAANGVDNLIILRMSAEDSPWRCAASGSSTASRGSISAPTSATPSSSTRPGPAWTTPPSSWCRLRQHPLHLLQPRDPAGQHGRAR
jgi:hypothetical protein